LSQCSSHMVIYLTQLDEVIIKATPNNNKLMQESLTSSSNHQIFPPHAVRPPFSNRQSTQNGNKPMKIAYAARRRKKVRCDSRRPTCSQCQEDGQPSCAQVCGMEEDWIATRLCPNLGSSEMRGSIIIRSHLRSTDWFLRNLSKVRMLSYPTSKARRKGGDPSSHAQAATRYELASHDTLPAGVHGSHIALHALRP
jgi:hypothetical protein